jgi:hypothetical protein
VRVSVDLAGSVAEMVGKAAVRPWLEAYLKAFKTHWNKPVQEFVVNDGWVFERYSYKSTDTPAGRLSCSGLVLRTTHRRL